MSNNVRIENRDLELARDELIAKERKPYTITKQREKWTEEEHRKFIEAIKFHGRDWLRIEDHIGTKTAIQIRSHAQKFFSKLEQGSGLLHGIKVPPPRPKRKSTHPYPRKLSSAFSKDIKSAPNFFSRYSNPLGSPDICMSTHQKLLQLKQGSGLLHDIKVPSPRMKHKSTHPCPWKLASSFSKEIKSASNFFSRYGNPLGSPDICVSTHQKLLQDDASHAEGGTSSSSSLSSPLSLPLPLSPSSSSSLSKSIRCRMCHPHCACTHANAHENNGEPHETSVTWPTLESLMSSPNSGFNPWPPQKNLKRELELHTSTYPTIKTLEPPLPPPLLRSTSPWPIPSSLYLQKTPHITTTHHFSVLEGSTGEIIIRYDGE